MRMNPTYKTLDGKIRQSLAAAIDGKILVLDVAAIATDALELGYEVEHLPKILIELIRDIEPKKYVGKRPPQRSYEMEIKDCELYAFKLFSHRFGCDVYFKFALKDGCLWVASLHKDRPLRVEG